MPHLVIETFLGKPRVAVAFSEPSNHERGRRPRPRRIEISEADAAMPLDLLKRLYAQQITEPSDPERIEREKLLKLAEDKKQDLMRRLRGIVNTSHHEGEIQAAKQHWKKLTGKDYE